MKFNFKPLSSFFKSTSIEEEKEDKEENKAGNNQGSDQGDDQEKKGNNQGDDHVDAENKTGDDQEKSISELGKEATINISQREYKGFIAVQTELEKFGKTTEDRNNFLKDASQLQVWYQAAIGAGATSSIDANAKEKSKSKKTSKVTDEAKAAYEKAAASNKK